MKITEAILDMIRMNQDVKGLSEKVSSLSREMRALDSRLIKTETRLDMIYDMLIQSLGRRSEPPPAPPAITNDPS
jgi:hypothetical protein